ncbi:MAG: GMP reductase [Flavobacteriaceae bacterium]|nr:GMP reductase [Flavobacteriaceae bacterium]
MRIESDLKLGFKDVMIRPKRSTLKSRSQVSLQREFKFLHANNNWQGIPIIAANMDTVGTFEMATALAKNKLITAVHKHYSIADWNMFMSNTSKSIGDYIAISTGIKPNDIEKLASIINSNPTIKFICIDVANGYSEHFIDFVKRIREMLPKTTIMAGNVVTGEMVEELVLSGVDVVKVGIGPGSVCTTRKMTGVGYPQLSAVIECADASHGLGGLICADGGCTVPGDIAKAFGAGADFIMLGGMLAGHDQAEQSIIEEDGEKYVAFYGMSSDVAMKKHKGGVAEYRASEGKTVKIPYRGDVSGTLQDITGGVRSACTYVGATQLKELSKRTTFIRVTQQINNIFGAS